MFLITPIKKLLKPNYKIGLKVPQRELGPFSLHYLICPTGQH
jgi:hypothetical protein